VVTKISNALDRADLSQVPRFANRGWLRLQPHLLTHFVAMTKGSAAEAQRLMGVAAARVSVIPNPPARPIAGAAPVALPGGRFVLGVGRLEPQKRWDRLIAALPALADQAVPLVILGEGSLRGELEAQVAALGLGGRVWLAGHAADPLPALARASVVALTSDYEGVPGVLREALSVGTPVVTTDSSVAVPEIVASPALGSIVARDDFRALVAALDRWLAPDAVRPAPVSPPGTTAAADYLALFDRLVG
jgi:glycosyltransferase involved in cell wall biosynthesis